jgi:hypothetical protein
VIRTDGIATIANHGSEALLRPLVPEHDFTLTNGGSIYLLRADSPAVEEWLEEHVGGETTYWADALVIEPRYVAALVEGLEAEGFVGSFCA